MARSKTRTGKLSETNPEATSVTQVEAAVAPVASSGENGKSQAKSQSRPEIVKPAPRPSVVPFSLEEEIRRRAFELYKQRGATSGSETDDWLVAGRESLPG